MSTFLSASCHILSRSDCLKSSAHMVLITMNVCCHQLGMKFSREWLRSLMQPSSLLSESRCVNQLESIFFVSIFFFFLDLKERKVKPTTSNPKKNRNGILFQQKWNKNETKINNVLPDPTTNPKLSCNQVSKQVRETLTKRANDFGIVLADVAITHLAFGDEFTKAIESKQVMYQEVI
jgi:hypothetical protein